jgi:RNA-binding protein
MNSKQRSELKGRAMQLSPIFSIGKGGITAEYIEAVKKALKTKELIKIHVLKGVLDDPDELAVNLSERTHSEVVQVIGRMIVLYKYNPDLHRKKVTGTKASRKINKTGSHNKVYFPAPAWSKKKDPDGEGSGPYIIVGARSKSGSRSKSGAGSKSGSRSKSGAGSKSGVGSKSGAGAKAGTGSGSRSGSKSRSAYLRQKKTGMGV